MHPSGMNDMYGSRPGQGVGGYGGYQGAMGGAYDMGFQHMGQQQFAGPQYGQAQGAFPTGQTASESTFAPGFTAPATGGEQQDAQAAAMNNVGGMGMVPLESGNLGSFPPQQGFAPYM